MSNAVVNNAVGAEAAGFSWSRGAATRIRAVMHRHWIVLRRSPHRWFEISFWPVVDALLWGSVGVYVAKFATESQRAGVNPLAGLTLFWAFTQAQFSIALGVNEETWTRNILNVLTTPIREFEYVIGIALFGLLKLMMTLGAVSLASVAFFGFHLGQVGWWSVPLIVLLVISGWALGLIGVGLVLRFGQSAEILIWGVNYVFLSLSGVFFPTSSLPGAFRVLAKALPPAIVFEQLRRIGSGLSPSGSALILCFVLSLVFFVAALAFVSHYLRVFRRNGYVTRYS